MLNREIAGLNIQIEILQGRGLIAKDRNLFGKRTTSDPYCQVSALGRLWGITRTCSNTVSPVWNQTFSIKLGHDQTRSLFQQEYPIVLQILDEDKNTQDDSMGVVSIPLRSYGNNTVWFPVEKGREGSSMYCRNAQGELEVKVQLQAHEWLNISPGSEYVLQNNHHQLHAGLRWNVEPTVDGTPVDLDCSCVAVDSSGLISMENSVYYGNLQNPNRSLVHSGDEKTGAQRADDESIVVKLQSLPPQIVALYFLLTVANPPHTLSQVKSAAMYFSDPETNVGLCRFVPAAMVRDSTALLLLRLSHQGRQWKLAPIAHANAYARDFGALIPDIKILTRDLVPNIHVDPRERMAIMRKHGVIRVADYLPRGNSWTNALSSFWANTLTLGLSWDVTGGQNIDLDASAVLLNAEYHVVDVVSFEQLTSQDNAIRHSGDEREGDEVGDDEKINIVLSRVTSDCEYIAFVINSYSGQELDDVRRASCHLFDPSTKSEVALYSMSRNRDMDGHTALLVGALFRDDQDRENWNFQIISEPSQGKVAKDCVPHLERFLRANPIHPPCELPEPEIVLSGDVDMPSAVPVEDEIVVIPEDELDQVLEQQRGL